MNRILDLLWRGAAIVGVVALCVAAVAFTGEMNP